MLDIVCPVTLNNAVLVVCVHLCRVADNAVSPGYIGLLLTDYWTSWLVLNVKVKVLY